jgi:serine protease AprX
MARRVLTTIVVLAMLGGEAFAADRFCDAKLDAVLRGRAHVSAGTSQVIVRFAELESAAVNIVALGGVPIRSIGTLGILVARVPDRSLHQLAASRGVLSVSVDRPVQGTMERTAATVGARWVRQELGLDGSGIGIALIDSGVTASHDDLDPERIVHFADFVNFRTGHYDDYGHGTHVAGIIAGNGRDSNGARVGVAPGANLIVLKALDGAGFGYSSNVIAALEYAIAHRQKFNIRVINLSVAAGVYESYNRDPLTLAAKRAVDAGIVVVAAGGNLGRNNFGKLQYGGITAPGNAPWVLTVGASNHKGTTDRSDDEVASFSSRGPSAIDRSAKPDLVAPGVAIESITEPSSVLFAAHPHARLWGTTATISQPYLSLSGTSMASPVVAGTIALMLEANPALTPNAVKGILQFTAEEREQYDHRAQGAGFLNARGAVELARKFKPGVDPRQLSQESTGDPVRWSRRIIWGNRRVSGGTITPEGTAWQRGVAWGVATTSAGQPVVWGALCGPGDTPCGEAPWTGGCDPGTPGCAPGKPSAAVQSDLLEEACDDPVCFADMWIAASAYVGHDLVLAGNFVEVAGAEHDERRGSVDLPAIRNGWPDDLLEAPGAGAAGSVQRTSGVPPRDRRFR